MPVSPLTPPADLPPLKGPPRNGPPGKGVPREKTVTVVWPSICAGPWGRWLGRVYGNRWGVRIGGIPLTLGWLMVIVTAPLASLLYLIGKAPRMPFVLAGPVNAAAVRYRLSTHRLLVEHPFEKGAPPVAELPLSGFDAIDIEIQPGQAWFRAGDVIFSQRGVERLRLAGVPRPDPFVRTVMKTQNAATTLRSAAGLEASAQQAIVGAT
jgi:hypothetical protein